MISSASSLDVAQNAAVSTASGQSGGQSGGQPAGVPAVCAANGGWRYGPEARLTAHCCTG